MYLMGSTRCGISAKTLERELGVTYKTAWRMFKQIRSMLSEDTLTLLKEVEIDETYVGGRRHGKTGRGAEGKTPVIGMVERKGKVVAKVVSNVKSSTVMPLVNKQVIPLTTVYTDEFSLYDTLPYVYPHECVNHGKKEYVVGKAHTNTIEGFWSLVKRGIDGTNHAVSPKYLQGYVNAYSFRWNHRDEDEPMFLQILSKLPSLKA
jgi:molybdenum-dependent DNA-binding transcriptional regulator ModE